MTDVAIPHDAEPVLVAIYAVRNAPDTVTLPSSPKVLALLESWLRANHFVPTPEGDAWHHDGLPELVDFERALGVCATLPV
jgi:hypothetical protein